MVKTVNEFGEIRITPDAAGHYSEADIRHACRLYEGQQISLVVGAGRSAWNPASTRRSITGPCEITYRQDPDGGWDAVIR